jgi:hypothetical protein
MADRLFRAGVVDRDGERVSRQDNSMEEEGGYYLRLNSTWPYGGVWGQAKFSAIGIAEPMQSVSGQPMLARSLNEECEAWESLRGSQK